MNSSDLFPMLGSVSIITLIVWVILEWRRMKHKYNLQNKLMDKFSSGPELNNFLQSSSGDKLMTFLTIGGIGPKEKLLSSVSKGIILSLLGIAFLFIGPFLQSTLEDTRGIQALGIAVLAVGTGFLLSTYVSYKLSKKWGIIQDSE
jgi:hypothetical protein